MSIGRNSAWERYFWMCVCVLVVVVYNDGAEQIKGEGNGLWLDKGVVVLLSSDGGTLS